MILFIMLPMVVWMSFQCYTIDNDIPTIIAEGMCHAFVASPANYTTGCLMCASLVHPTATMTKVYNNNVSSSLVAEYNHSGWIGLRDVTGSWDWRWEADNTAPMAYAPWASMEPSNDGNCVVMLADGRWDDRLCADNEPFFCSYAAYECWNVSLASASVCSSRGACVARDNCTCSWCYTGDACELGPYCYGMLHTHAAVCDGAGTCARCDECVCNATSYGTVCDERIAMALGDSTLMELRVLFRLPVERAGGHRNNETDIAVACSLVMHQPQEDNLGPGSACFFETDGLWTSVLVVLLGSDTEIVGNTTISLHSVSEPLQNVTLPIEWSTTLVAPPGDDDTNFGDYVVPIVVVVVCIAGCIVCLVVVSVVGCVIGCRTTTKHFDSMARVDSMVEMDESVAEKIRVNKKLFCIDYDNMTIERRIGSGGGGAIVYKGSWEGHEIAFKCFKGGNLWSNVDEYKEFEREASMLMSLRHPNIITVFGCTVKPPRVGIVMELCKNGDLTHYVTTAVTTFFQRVEMMRQVALALGYIHAKVIVHRDVKPENVLLDDALVVKLMDFGMGREALAKMTTHVGTRYYMAPEVTCGQVYGTSCDVFSFGMMMFVVLAIEFSPYGEGLPSMAIDQKVAMDPTFRPRIDVVRSTEGYMAGTDEIIEQCWQHEPDERPSMTDISFRLDTILS